MLYHRDTGPALWIHINAEAAYLHYFLGEASDSAGLQSVDSSAIETDALVHFLQLGGVQADAIDMPRDTIVDVDRACRAAVEFLRRPAPPPSIEWRAL